jgi:hypothetical protein
MPMIVPSSARSGTLLVRITFSLPSASRFGLLDVENRLPAADHPQVVDGGSGATFRKELGMPFLTEDAPDLRPSPTRISTTTRFPVPIDSPGVGR